MRVICPRFALLLVGFVSACAMSRRAETPGEPTDVGFISRVDGSTQYYVELLPKPFRPSASHDLLIVLHGHGADRWQCFTADRGETRGARDTAARHRMILVAPDYRAKTSWMSPEAEADVLQIIEEQKARRKIGRVVVAGGSMGGASALIFTTLHPDLVDGVVSHNGTANMLEYANFQDAIAAAYGGNGQERPEVYRARSPEFFPDRFRMPVALTTGGRDDVVPPDSVLRLAAAIKRRHPDVLLIHRPEGGHETNYEDTIAAYEFVIGRMRGNKANEGNAHPSAASLVAILSIANASRNRYRYCSRLD